MKTNSNFDLSKLPDDYYEELDKFGWIDEHTTFIYVRVDEYDTAIIVLKIEDDIAVLRMFRMGNTIAFSVDIKEEFSKF